VTHLDLEVSLEVVSRPVEKPTHDHPSKQRAGTPDSAISHNIRLHQVLGHAPDFLSTGPGNNRKALRLVVGCFFVKNA